MCPRLPTPPKIQLNTTEHPDTHAAALAWHHITQTHPFSPATDRVSEYVAAMLDSLVIDSLDDRARLVDLMLLAQKMRKSLEGVKKELLVSELSEAGDEGEVVEILEGEVEKVAVRILRKEKTCQSRVAAELEMDEREWVMV